MGCSGSSSHTTQSSDEHVVRDQVVLEHESRKVTMACTTCHASNGVVASASKFRCYNCNSVQHVQKAASGVVPEDRPQKVSIACGYCFTLNEMPVASPKFKCYQCDSIQKVNQHSLVNQMQTKMECGLRAFNNIMQSIKQEPSTWGEFDDIARNLEEAEQALCHSESIKSGGQARSDQEGNFNIEVLQVAAQRRGYDLDPLRSCVGNRRDMLGVIIASGKHFWCMQKHSSSPTWRPVDSLTRGKHDEASKLQFTNDEELLAYLARRGDSLFPFVLAAQLESDAPLIPAQNFPTLLTTTHCHTEAGGRGNTKSSSDKFITPNGRSAPCIGLGESAAEYLHKRRTL